MSDKYIQISELLDFVVSLRALRWPRITRARLSRAGSSAESLATRCDKTEASNTAQCPIQCIPPRMFTLTVMTPQNIFGSFVRVLEHSNYLSLSISQ